MATATLELHPYAAKLPDGSANNLPCAIGNYKGTQTAPPAVLYLATLDFDQVALEHAIWQFTVPTDYASAPVFKIEAFSGTASATTAIFEVRVFAVTPGGAEMVNDAFGGINTITLTMGGTAFTVVTGSVALGTLPGGGLAANDLIAIQLRRNAGTHAADCRVTMARLEYTTT